MKSTTPAALAYLPPNGRPKQTIMPNVYTLTLATDYSSEVYTFTDFDVPVRAYTPFDPYSGVLGIGELDSFILGGDSATFTGTISGTMLTVSDVVGIILPGQLVTGVGVPSNTVIISGSGSSWVVSNTATIGPEAMASEMVYILTTFVSDYILITGLKYKSSVGLTVDEQTITVGAKPTDLLFGMPFLQAVQEGVLDGAYLQRDRAILTSWQAPAIGLVNQFYGRISTIDSVGRLEAKIKVKTDIVLLDRDYPRNLYAPTCRWTLFQYGCNIGWNPDNPSIGDLPKTDFTYSGVVGISPTNLVIPWASAIAGDFNQGTITFTSGVLDGLSFTIAISDGSNLFLALPLPETPSAGDTFNATWGCDHTYGANGCTKFSNTANFGGFDQTPVITTGI